MTRHFIAVGGTGQHVALSLADFLVLAHSVTADPLPAVEFLLLDSDPAAAGIDTPSAWQLCVDQLRVLAQVPDRAEGAPEEHWRSPIPSIGEGVHVAREAIDDVLGVGATHLLVSRRQAEIPVASGYHGEPRVAAILTDVLLDRLASGQLPENDELRRIAAAVTEAGTRVCVAGSTVGGTGAGVLPRLVEYFAKTERLAASICALVGLEWFQIDNDSSNQERMAANSVASLWHYVQNQARGNYRLVLWGHPDVGQARRERGFGNRSQGSKTDLTLPYYAAAAGAAFLLGGETANERVTPVRTAGALQLTKALQILPGADLHWLIERNRDLLGRLDHLVAYLERPYTGNVLPPFRSGAFVSELDGLSTLKRQDLLRRTSALTAAKLRALRRLTESDATLNIQGPRPRKGIPVLASWVDGKVPSLDVFPALLDAVALETQTASAARILPLKATLNADFDGQPIGARARLSNTHVDALADFKHVEGTHVPDVYGIERILRTAFNNEATYWTTNGVRLPSLLLDRSGPAVPPTLGSLDSDTLLPWLQRWFVLLSALCTGAASIRRLPRAVLGITDAVIVNVDGGAETTIGYLAPEFACIPNLSEFWFQGDAIQSLVDRIGAVRKGVAPWLRALRLAGVCKYDQGSIPQWVKFLTETFGESSTVDLRADVGRTVSLAWGGTTKPVGAPLPAVEQGLGEPLSEVMAAAFELEIKDLTREQPGFSASEKAAWQDLNSHRYEGALLDRESADWKNAVPLPIIWIDLVGDRTRAALHGKIYFHPGRGYAWRYGAGVRLLTQHEVFTSAVGVFHPEPNKTLATSPVKVEFSPLLESCLAKVQPDGSVTVATKLVGRAAINMTIPASRTRQFDRLTIFSWPKIAALPNGSHSVLFQSGITAFRYRVLYGGADKRVSAASATLNNENYRHYLVPSQNSIAADSRPVALAVIALEDSASDGVELGLLPYPDVFRAPAGETEVWSVDLGTSSTVIARRLKSANAADTTIVHPTKEADATMVYSMGSGVDREDLIWYPTWDDTRPVSSKTFIMPSQIVELSKLDRKVSPDITKHVFGRDFTLDHGEKIDDSFQNAIVDNLKWRTDGRQAYRKHFILHLLEQSLAMEYARTGSLAREIDVTFTLPLRQRDDVGRFVKEVKEVVAALKERTGVQFRPNFQWESLAIAPANLSDETGMVVVADLGGGTLDLFGAWYEGGAMKKRAVDSAYIGGHQCVSILHRRQAWGTEGLTSSYRRVRSGDFNVKELAGNVPAVRQYFEILYRYIVLWSATLRKKWDVADQVPTDLQLAGLGWSLPGCPGRQTAVADLLTRTAHDMGLAFSFESSGTDGFRGEERKIRLALECARVGGVPEDEIAKSADSVEMVLGLETIADGQTFAATEAPGKVGVRKGAARVTETVARTLIPDLERTMLDELSRRLATRSDPRDPTRGALDPNTYALELSPLTCLAEIAVADLVAKQS